MNKKQIEVKILGLNELGVKERTVNSSKFFKLLK
jgi:hypothetical protein